MSKSERRLLKGLANGVLYLLSELEPDKLLLEVSGEITAALLEISTQHPE